MLKPLLTAIFVYITLLTQAQSLLLAKQFHGSDSQANTGVAIDINDNIYTACSFYGDVDVNPGPGTTLFTSLGSQDVAIVKLNSAGTFVWGIQLAGSGFQTSSVIKTDAVGNVFIFGYFSSTVDMDPGVGVYNLVSVGAEDIYCGKYDASGNLLWAVKIGGVGTEQNYGFDLDDSGNAFLYGYFQNTVDFNPGVGVNNLISTTNNADFLLKLNSDGTFNYVIQMGTAYGSSLVIDPSNNMYFTGNFFNTIDFNPGVGVNNLTAVDFTADCFVLKLNNLGEFVWVGKIAGPNSENSTSLAYDIIGDAIIVTGIYEGTIDANPGVGVFNLISAGYYDSFITKLNASTGEFIWGKSIGGLGFQSISAIRINASGKIYAAGISEQTCDFDPGLSTYNLTSNGSTDIFRLSLNNDGSFSNAEEIGGTNNDNCQSLELDNSGAEIICGFFEGIVDFDPGVGITNLNSAFTGWDGYLAQYCTTYTINNSVAICSGESYFAGGALQTTSGDYYDYFIPVEGCDSIVITHLTVNTPVVNLGPNTAICIGNSITLNASNPGATYLWNTGATTQTILVSAAGNYNVTIIDPAGCTAFDAITITVNPAPEVDLGADIILCSGETTILNAANPGSTYLWNTGATTQTITVSVAGNYNVTATNVFGCSDNDIIHVFVNPTPIVNLGDIIEICAADGIVLDAENTGSDYIWNTGATTQTIFTNTSGNYTVTVTNLFGCDATDNVNIIAHNAPIINLGADIDFCDGNSVLLNATTPLATYLWNTGATTATITVTETGIYSVTVTNNFGCIGTDEIVVTKNPTPIVDLGADINLCSGDSIILSALNPASTYLWNTGETSAQITANTSGNYSVIVTNIYGCAENDDVFITVNPTPFIYLGDDILVCSDETISLNATTPDCTYLWNTGETASDIDILATGIYFVKITNGFGCSFIDSILVEIIPVPIVNLGSDLSFCTGGTAILDATNPSCSYLWNTGESTNTIEVTDAGMYIVTVTNALGCFSSDTINVELFSAPVVDLGADIIACDNADIILDATTPLCTYNWNTGETSASIFVTDAGEYSVIVTNSFSCTDTDFINVEILESPVIEFILPETICADTVVLELTALPAGGVFSGDAVTGNVFDPAEAGLGLHSLYYTYTNANGCITVDTQQIEVTICQEIYTENNLITLNIFPNPTDNNIQVFSSKPIQIDKLEITDMYGRIVYAKIFDRQLQEIQTDISFLPSGNYFMHLTNTNTNYLLPFIVSK